MLLRSVNFSFVSVVSADLQIYKVNFIRQMRTGSNLGDSNTCVTRIASIACISIDSPNKDI